MKGNISFMKLHEDNELPAFVWENFIMFETFSLNKRNLNLSKILLLILAEHRSPRNLRIIHFDYTSKISNSNKHFLNC